MNEKPILPNATVREREEAGLVTIKRTKERVTVEIKEFSRHSGQVEDTKKRSLTLSKIKKNINKLRKTYQEEVNKCLDKKKMYEDPEALQKLISDLDRMADDITKLFNRMIDDEYYILGEENTKPLKLENINEQAPKVDQG